LIRNRISAKKSRLKKKQYIKCLEQKIEKLEDKIELLEASSKSTKSNISFEYSLSFLENSSKIYIRHMNDAPYNLNINQVDEKTRIQNEYQNSQRILSFGLFKALIKSLVPLEIKYFEAKCSVLKDYLKAVNVDVFIEILVENQYILNEVYNFHLTSEATISFPFHVYMFFEQIKKLAIDFKSSSSRIGSKL